MNERFSLRLSTLVGLCGFLFLGLSAQGQSSANDPTKTAHSGLTLLGQNAPVGEHYVTVEVATNNLLSKIDQLTKDRTAGGANATQSTLNEWGVKSVLFNTTLEGLNNGKSVQESLALGLDASMRHSIDLGFNTQTTRTLFTGLNAELQL